MKAALRDLQRQAAAELPSQGLHEDLSARAKVLYTVSNVQYCTVPGILVNVVYQLCSRLSLSVSLYLCISVSLSVSLSCGASGNWL